MHIQEQITKKVSILIEKKNYKEAKSILLNFIKTAKSKGLSQKIIIRKHVLKESILPIIDYLAPASAGLMTGSIIIEQIFGLPGIGRYFVVGALQRDYTLVSGVMILYATLLIILILFSDILRAFLDPRVKLK